MFNLFTKTTPEMKAYKSVYELQLKAVKAHQKGDTEKSLELSKAADQVIEGAKELGVWDLERYCAYVNKRATKDAIVNGVAGFAVGALIVVAVKVGVNALLTRCFGDVDVDTETTPTE